MKQLLSKTPDIHMALLIYRSTPLLWCGLSPAELLMGRQLRNNVPKTQESLVPEWKYLKSLREADIWYKEKQRNNYDHHYKTKSLPLIDNNKEVYIIIIIIIIINILQDYSQRDDTNNRETTEGNKKNSPEGMPGTSPDTQTKT